MSRQKKNKVSYRRIQSDKFFTIPFKSTVELRSSSLSLNLPSQHNMGFSSRDTFLPLMSVYRFYNFIVYLILQMLLSYLHKSTYWLWSCKFE